MQLCKVRISQDDTCMVLHAVWIQGMDPSDCSSQREAPDQCSRLSLTKRWRVPCSHAHAINPLMGFRLSAGASRASSPHAHAVSTTSIYPIFRISETWPPLHNRCSFRMTASFTDWLLRIVPDHPVRPPTTLSSSIHRYGSRNGFAIRSVSVDHQSFWQHSMSRLPHACWKWHRPSSVAVELYWCSPPCMLPDSF